MKVLDFGLAKAVRIPRLVGQPERTAPDDHLARRHDACGYDRRHGRYMAPEQARGQAVDRRADIWAFGCVLYEWRPGACRGWRSWYTAGRRSRDNQDHGGADFAVSRNGSLLHASGDPVSPSIRSRG